MKTISNQNQWGNAKKELQNENIKLKSYDNTIIQKLGNIKNKRTLDYGCGPGVLISVLKKLGADVKGFDISEEMIKACGEKIGKENVYKNVSEIPTAQFDIIICNLVLCIVEEPEVKNICKNIAKILNKNGLVYIGFCNPKIFNVKESQLDFRFQTGNKYEENHIYKKIKKEGNYKILELHRPIEWYEKVYKEADLKLLEILFTPEYELKGNKINDFVIFKLCKTKKYFFFRISLYTVSFWVSLRLFFLQKEKD